MEQLKTIKDLTKDFKKTECIQYVDIKKSTNDKIILTIATYDEGRSTKKEMYGSGKDYVYVYDTKDIDKALELGAEAMKERWRKEMNEK